MLLPETAWHQAVTRHSFADTSQGDQAQHDQLLLQELSLDNTDISLLQPNTID